VDFERWTVVVVPFLFTDRVRDRRRPAVVVSQPEALVERVGHSVLAMVTSARNPSWPLDVPLSDHSGAGLEAPSVVRMKLFTLDNRFILRTIGRLGEDDRKAVAASLAALLGTERADAGGETG
jgi:mRNA interferase MazF